jgi:hypothetical protein
LFSGGAIYGINIPYLQMVELIFFRVIVPTLCVGTIISAKKEGSPKAAFCSSGKSDQDKNPPSTFNETPVV